jgi:RNA polymerase sigma-70 factor (ECF subfamily)
MLVSVRPLLLGHWWDRPATVRLEGLSDGSAALVRPTHARRPRAQVANRIGGSGQEWDVGHDGEVIRTSITTPDAFAGIFEAHYRTIDAYCVRRLGADGHDVSAATFTEAFRVRSRFDVDRADARPWLYGIASNLLRHHRRRERNRWRAYARSEAVGPSTFDADARVDADRLAAPLGAALRSIPPRDRDALLLFAWADLSYEQIGESLGIPVGTVRSRISRARSRLRAALADVVLDDPEPDAPELSGVPERGEDA